MAIKQNDKWVLKGVVSATLSSACDGENHIIFTHVGHFVNWILDTFVKNLFVFTFKASEWVIFYFRTPKPKMCIFGGVPPDCCINGGSGPYCCENGANNENCCENNGRGPFCCTNGAINPDCTVFAKKP